ncbi:MAG: hypothetical protein JWP01_2065 [Myxococcales bacterium]|nr:hypothetical protein [Myxococcales bacterium]
MYRSLTIPAACFTLAAALGACAADNGDEGIFVTKNVAASASCTFTADEGAAFLSHGTYSIHATTSYALHPQMVSRVTASAGQQEARTIIMRGARVNLRIPDETVLSAAQQESLRASGVMKFSALFTAPLPPNGGIATGELDVITPALLDQIVMAKGAGILAADAPSFRTEVIASVVVYGDMSGSEITSQEFQFPITICNDCVVNELGACPLPAGTVPRPGNACNPFQDGSADCCRLNDEVICPATVAAAAQ